MLNDGLTDAELQRRVDQLPQVIDSAKHNARELYDKFKAYADKDRENEIVWFVVGLTVLEFKLNVDDMIEILSDLSSYRGKQS